MMENNKDNAMVNDQIYRVLYSSKVSTSRSPKGIHEDFNSIFLSSKDNNAKNGVTGVLVTNKRTYTQLIEGPILIVKDLIGHISCDERNYDLRVISNYKSHKRIFSNWSMAFIIPNSSPQTDADLFPPGDTQSNIMAVSAFCMSIRYHLLESSFF